MNCYYCNRVMDSGNAKFDTWGDRKVLTHRSCDRQTLITRAHEMGLFVAPEERTDQEIIDAIAAEKLSGEWLERLDRLSTR